MSTRVLLGDRGQTEWNTGWVPRQLVWSGQRPVVKLCRLASEALRQPFLSMEPVQGRPQLVALDEMPEPPASWSPRGFVFHGMRCGSTLLATLLAQPSGHRVLSEPLLVEDVASRPGVEETRRMRWIRSLMFLYARGVGSQDQPLFVKWSSGMCRHMELLDRSFPNVASLFLFRDPLEVLVSCAEVPVPGDPDAAFDALAPELRPRDASALAALPRLEQSALRVASCCMWAGRQRRTALLDYASLPHAAWTILPAYFGMTLDQQDVDQMRAVSAFHAKEPGRVFVPDADNRRTRADATIRILAAQIVQPALDELLRRQRRLD